MRRPTRSLWLGLALAGSPAVAQTIVTSPGPAEVDVTVYRDPMRPPDRAPNLGWLNGFALISETRQVTLPAGESELRFEGVAGGILPQSAIVTGLPEGIVERNRDAYLLSPATILDRSLGRRVHLRRTSVATGEVREQEAIVRSGADGAVVLETDEGIEALRCTGLRETLVYDQVPPGLSVRPTLSVRARSREPINAMVTLSYLATGLDWQANYVATLSPREDRIDLFAWLTIANGDETGFVQADTQAVAGRLNRDYVRATPPEGGPLQLQCWPSGTTSDIPQEEAEENVVVTGSRIGRESVDAMLAPPPPPSPAPAMQAVQEELGDLKLYRIPEPVTVAARSQKQVSFLTLSSIRVRSIYRRRLAQYNLYQAAFVPARRVLVTRNRENEGLGVPLPAGRLVLFASGAPRPILIGEGSVGDRAVGEDVEIDVGPATGVHSRLRIVERSSAGRVDLELTVTNDRRVPIAFEAEIEGPPNAVVASSPVQVRNGTTVWQATLPANGSAILRFSYVPV